MPEVFFIDPRNASRSERTQAKRHAALHMYLRKIPINTVWEPPRTQTWALTTSTSDIVVPRKRSRHLTPSKSSTRIRKIAKRSTLDARVLCWKLQPVTNPRPPEFELRTQHSLREISSWVTAHYNMTWLPQLTKDPSVFDTKAELLVFREAFFIVQDLFAMGRISAAFTVLQRTLDAIPPLLHELHPGFLFAAVEIAHEANITADPELDVRVRKHLADLAAAILGKSHPLAIVMGLELTSDERAHIGGVFFDCVADSFESTFVDDFDAKRSQQRGPAGSSNARNSLDAILARLNTRWGADHAISRLAALEVQHMRKNDFRYPGPGQEAQARKSLRKFEVMSCVFSVTGITARIDRHYEREVGTTPPLEHTLTRFRRRRSRNSFALQWSDRPFMRAGCRIGSELIDSIAAVVESSLGSTRLSAEDGVVSNGIE
jgi:hypothetical protein